MHETKLCEFRILGQIFRDEGKCKKELIIIIEQIEVLKIQTYK